MFMRLYIEIFDDGPVGPVALAGPSPDPEQVILEEELRRLSREHGDAVRVRRYNLGREPRQYLEHPPVAALLRERGPAVLPVTLVNGRVVKTGAYPGYGELEPAGADDPVLLAWERALAGGR